jgi:phage FluMu protein Com
MKPFTGYRCNHCNKPYASKGSAQRHEVKCPHDINNRACATCKHSSFGEGEGERTIRYCDLTGQPELEIYCQLWEAK